MMKRIMIFASEVPVISALNPYRQIEDVFTAAWKRTNPKQFDMLQKELQLVVMTPSEKVEALVQDLGATADLQSLIEEAAAAKTVDHVLKTAARIASVLPPSTPLAVKQEIIQHSVSEMHKSFGIQQEEPAILKYEQAKEVKVSERNLSFLKTNFATVGGYKVLIGGKIDGKTEKKVIEVKNRLHRFMTPLPKYDIAQLQTYLFILGAKQGEVVEHLRHDIAQTKVTSVHWDQNMWEKEISPFLLRFCNALSHFMKDSAAQEKFLKVDAVDQREIIRDHWVKDMQFQYT